MKIIIHISILLILFLVLCPGCFILDNAGEQIYAKGKYTIRKKNILSYYNASPDLFVKTEKGEIKINLSPYAISERMAQEKITEIEIRQINTDSIQIFFSSSDSAYQVKKQVIPLNVKNAVDSILAKIH